MRTFLFLLLICLATTALPQNNLDKDIEQMQRRLDSSRIATDSFLKLQMKRNDSIEMARFNEQSSRNLNSLMRTMKEREEKQKRGMWLRLGFGIAMLVVLIVGLLKKRKKKESQ